MATTIRAFNIGLYEEHLEEISFLYEQRIAMLKNTEMGWRDLAPFEARLEAHMDALLVGRELALEVCQRLAKEGDFGQLFAAVSVFCRQRQAPLLAEVLRTMDFADPQKVTAVADALKFELPEEWSTFIAQALARREARLVPMLATVSGYRRLATGTDLVDSLAQKPTEAQQLIEALGRLHATEAEGVLTDYLLDVNGKFRNPALLALLRMGAIAPLPSVETIVAQANLSVSIVALGAGRATASALLQLLQAGEADSNCLLALGLLGDPGTLRAIYNCLDAPELAGSAAQALYWITGLKTSCRYGANTRRHQSALMAYHTEKPLKNCLWTKKPGSVGLKKMLRSLNPRCVTAAASPTLQRLYCGTWLLNRAVPHFAVSRR
jgi:hypothetical protein